MPDTLRDGKGRGSLASVTEDNRLDVSSRSGERIYYESRDNANALGVGTPFLTITETGGFAIYAKNVSSSQNLVITDLRFNWNGGSTNHDRCVFATFYFNCNAPTANNTTGAAGVLNKSSNNTFNIDVEYWNEVGDGMTISGGTPGFNFIVGKGSTYLNVQGAIILGPNTSVCLNLKAEEVGEASVSFLGFMEDN